MLLIDFIHDYAPVVLIVSERFFFSSESPEGFFRLLSLCKIM